MALARRLQAAGCQLLAVHCRRRSDNQHRGPPDYVVGKALVDALDIPVVVNGGVYAREDVERVAAATGCHAIMLAQGLLTNPAFLQPSP